MRIITLFMTIALTIPMMGMAGNSEQETKERMKSDLDTIRNVFDVGYAPKEWKNFNFGWDLDTEIQKAKNNIQNVQGITVKKYQKIVSDFFNSTKDYHAGVYFYSTEQATLPFTIKPAEGRFFISNIDFIKLNPLIYPLHVGDELVLFDNRLITDVMKELLANNSSHANDSTDLILASFFLTHRTGALGYQVPKGPINIGVKSPGCSDVKEMQLIWTYKPEKISNGFLGLKDVEKLDKQVSAFTERKLYDPLMIMPQYEFLSQFFAAGSNDEQEEFIASRKSYIPTLGTRLWWTSPHNSLFHAYIYETEDHKLIGYVRIPHYMGGFMHVKEFAGLMGLFQERTDALVIDQLNNPGGILLYMYALLSTLTEKPLYVPKQKMMITQEMVYGAFEDLEILQKINSDQEAQEILGFDIGGGIPVTYQTVQFYIDYLNFIISEWNSGKKLTELYPISGMDRILPHPSNRYTKPILLLTNSLDISCGDFFPAILQDNKRVTILGSRTAGAGGYISTTMFPNRFGIQGFSYTGSIAERLNKDPIENLGVTPDIPYEISANDIQGDYQEYVEAINAAVYNLLSPQSNNPSIDKREKEKEKEPQVDNSSSKKKKKFKSKG